ncbi:hypothetical protein FRB91_005793 [Serendipita sp. 411]|nr:hypothetical protein FRC18_008046 [Serendipita sp. 400]KAG8859923.1 hypothetical protein FRB91_005793 [Serendipita sp. 411]
MSKDSKQSVLQFLDSLDNIPAAPSQSSKPTPNAPTTGATGGSGDAAEALAFLDELTQQSSRPTRVLTPGPRVRNATDPGRKSSGSPAPSLSKATGATQSAATTSSANTSTSNAESVKPNETAGGGWGWGSVWNTASAAIAQAKTVVDEQVKQLPKQLPNDQAKKWGEGVMTYVKQAQLDKIGSDLKTVGMSTLTQMMNAVAPPIAEHEVIQAMRV